MKKVLDILRRKFDGRLTNRETAEACQVSPSTVSEVLGLFEASKLPWPLPWRCRGERGGTPVVQRQHHGVHCRGGG